MKKSALVSMDIKTNFWEVNSGFLVVKDFRELHEKDDSERKIKSSRFMWALSLYCKPTSDLAHLPEEARLKIINNDFLDKVKLDPEKKHSNLISQFELMSLSRLERIAKDWGDKLDERFQLLKDIKYNLANAEDLDKMMSRTDKLWQQYISCINDLDTEEAKSQVEGGAMESLNESGLI